VLDSATGSELQALKAPPPADEPVTPRAVSLLTVGHGWIPDVERWLLSVFTHCKADFEAIVVDNSGDARMAGWLHTRAAYRLRTLRLDPPLGFATAVNAGIEAATGDICVVLDPDHAPLPQFLEVFEERHLLAVDFFSPRSGSRARGGLLLDGRGHCW